MLNKPLNEKSAALFRHYFNKKYGKRLKYATRIFIDKAELDLYKDYFIKCELMGFKFIFVCKEREKYYEFFGFSNFEIAEMDDSHCTDFTKYPSYFLDVVVDDWLEEAESIFISAYPPEINAVVKKFRLN